MKKLLMLSAALAVAAGLTTSASASSLALDNTSNAGLIEITSGGVIQIDFQPSSNFDGDDDVAYNVINNSNVSVPGFTVTGVVISGESIGSFDGDGVDDYFNSAGVRIHAADAGAGGTGLGGPDPLDYTGWNQNGTQNSYVVHSITDIDVIFNGGLAAGQGAFISFEQPGSTSGTVVTSLAPLPPAVWSGLALVLGIGAYTRFAKTKIA